VELPKKSMIAGRIYNVTLKDGTGGDYNGLKREINVGKDSGGDVLNIYLHEIFESVLDERLHKYHVYGPGENDKVIFVFNHAEFCNLVDDWIVSINDLLKPEYQLYREGENDTTSTETKEEEKESGGERSA